MQTRRFTTGKKQWQQKPKPKWKRVPPFEVSYAFDVAVVVLLLIALAAYLLA